MIMRQTKYYKWIVSFFTTLKNLSLTYHLLWVSASVGYLWRLAHASIYLPQQLWAQTTRPNNYPPRCQSFYFGAFLLFSITFFYLVLGRRSSRQAHCQPQPWKSAWTATWWASSQFWSSVSCRRNCHLCSFRSGCTDWGHFTRRGRPPRHCIPRLSCRQPASIDPGRRSRGKHIGCRGATTPWPS